MRKTRIKAYTKGHKHYHIFKRTHIFKKEHTL